MDLTPERTTILLHVGIHKTGSTSLQKNFAKHRPLLRAGGIRFLGHGGPYRNLYSAFLTDPMRFFWNKQSKLNAEQIRLRDQQTLADLRTRLTRCQGQTIIISSERLSMLQPSELQALRGFLTPYGTVKAVFFYRELDSWISSNSQEMAKSGIATEPTDFTLALRRIREMPLRVADAFGPDNTTFIRFEDAIQSGICDTFLSTFGLPTLTELGGEEVIANQSISDAAVEALFDYNRQFPLGNPERNPKEVARIMALPGKKYQAPGFSRKEIAQYAQARAEVGNTLGFRLKAPEHLPVRRIEVTDLFGRAVQSAEQRILKILGKAS
ncbi:hypothetical protein [Ruegeria jejuensis]|uniref:hypothetical protein n=1 Tax=Ruegeria jejuensis TaxID=3233338 RepID=UPI00355C6FA3